MFGNPAELQSRCFPFVLDKGLLLAFNRAIGEPAQREAIPLTYIMAADQFDPRFDRRPIPGQSWLEQSIESYLHVEQTLTYHAPVNLGMSLQVEKRLGRIWEKQGRSGKLQFIETITEIQGDSGKPLVTSSWVDVKAEKSHNDLTLNQKEQQAKIESKEEKTFVIADGLLSDPQVNIDKITRTQLVMYVGATGDFHPFHHDDVYARSQNYPGVFAPGMLTMAINGKAITDRYPQDTITAFGGRYKGQVWPGDTLITRVSDSDSQPNKILATTTNQHGKTVFEAWASLR